MDIVDNCSDMLGPASRAVNILNAKPKFAAESPRKIMRTKCRKCVTHMQLPIWTRRKSGDDSTAGRRQAVQISVYEFQRLQKISPVILHPVSLPS